MKIAVCTLFEGDYHYGVGALANSLYASGFRGVFYVAYRGLLPPWVDACSAGRGQMSNLISPSSISVSDRQPLGSEGPTDFSPFDGLTLRFLPIKTETHFTNYKPKFMLALLDAVPELDILAYLDPDICVDAPWSWFEDVLQCGVVVCEDINSPLHEYHPRRMGWRRAFTCYDLQPKGSAYANGGFLAISRENTSFLNLWHNIQKQLNAILGGGDVVNITGGRKVATYGFANCFDKTDQDALNAAIEAYQGNVSFLGRQAMGFQSGGSSLPHALGNPKPWSKNYFKSFFEGYPPTVADKAFWNIILNGPIQPFSGTKIQWTRRAIRLLALAGRFYARR